MFGKDKIGKVMFGKTRIAPQTPIALSYKSAKVDKRDMTPPIPAQNRKAMPQ